MITATASALLALTRDARARARRHVAGFRRVQSQLGDDVAAWAYADKGIGPGMRAPCETVKILTKWRPSGGDWLRVIIGPQGIGKSVAAARYIADRGGTMVSATATDGWGFSGGDALVRAVSAEWLLIDDLGESKTRPGDGNIATVIADRYARRSRCFTVITTALTVEEIRRRYGDNIADRIRPHVVELFMHETESRRGAVSPSLNGFNREMEIHWYGERVEYAAAGVLASDASREAMTRFAELVGIDMNGDAMKAQLVEQQARAAEMSRLGTEMLATLAERSPALRLIPQPDPAAQDLMDWIDTLAAEVEAGS